MSRLNAREKSKMGRPSVDSEEVRARVERPLLNALADYAASVDLPLTRSQALRTILADWLATHGYLKRSKNKEPVGPATEVVRAMDTAINEHRATRKK